MYKELEDGKGRQRAGQGRPHEARSKRVSAEAGGTGDLKEKCPISQSRGVSIQRRHEKRAYLLLSRGQMTSLGGGRGPGRCGQLHLSHVFRTCRRVELMAAAAARRISHRTRASHQRTNRPFSREKMKRPKG